MAPLVRTTGVVSVNFWDFSLFLAKGGGYNTEFAFASGTSQSNRPTHPPTPHLFAAAFRLHCHGRRVGQDRDTDVLQWVAVNSAHRSPLRLKGGTSSPSYTSRSAAPCGPSCWGWGVRPASSARSPPAPVLRGLAEALKGGPASSQRAVLARPRSPLQRVHY